MRGLSGRCACGRGEKLLLVEDDHPVRRAHQLLLRGCGYDVRAYGDGRRALADPAALEAICLITDHEMETIDGPSLLRAFRALGWQGIAILLTGISLEVSSREASGVYFEVVMKKPVDDHGLLDVVSRSLTRA